MNLPLTESRMGVQHTQNLDVIAVRHDAVRAELERILCSSVFRNAKGQSRFLRYVVERTLEGRASEIKEYSIGVDVFERGRDFDPRTSNVVRTEANRLRSKLALFYQEQPSCSGIQIDLPKGGYTPVFLDVTAPADPVQIAESFGAQSESRPFSIRTVSAVIAISLIIVAGIGWSVQRWLSSGANFSSIAVLPFVNQSPQVDEVVSDGLTDELINSFGRIPDLHVVARTSAFQYKDKSLDVRRIGKELNVKTVLEGTLRQVGDHVHITAQLIDTENGYRLWSKTFDSTSGDVLQMQSEISRSIVDALGLELTGATNATRDSKVDVTGNPEAYRSYLRGVYFANKRNGENVERAIAYFEEAIKRAPTFARSYSGLARCYSMLPQFTRVPVSTVFDKWKAAALKALELDPTLGEAHVALAENYEVAYDWDAAKREFEAGLKADPGNADVYRTFSLFLARTGNLSGAIVQAKKSLELDPVSASASNSLAKYLYQSRRFEEATEQYKNSVQLDPNDGIAHQGLALVYLNRSMYREAIEETEKSKRIMNADPFITGQLGYAYGKAGNQVRAREILATLAAQPTTLGTVALAMCNVYLSLGERDKALDLLSKAAAQHDIGLFVQTDPIYDPVRSDPRFSQVLSSMHLR